MTKGIKRTILFTTLLLLFFLNFSVVLAVELPNPLGSGVTDPRAIIGNVIKALLGIVGSLALLVFILGGFTWVIAAGSEEKIKKGKDMVMWAAFGLVIIFMSYAIVTFVLGAITGSTGATSVPGGEETRVPGGK